MINQRLRRTLSQAKRRLRPRPVGRPAAEPTTATRLAFIHVPKCGGTSVDAALRAGVGVTSRDGWINPGITREEARAAVGEGVPHLAVPRWLDHRAYLLWHYLSERHPVVSGHGPVTSVVLDRFADDTPFVTVLRDPVDRWISYFRASYFTADDRNLEPNRHSRLEPRALLDEVLASPSGRYIGAFAAIYLGGHRPYTDADAADAVEPALEALSRFSVVGFTSDWRAFGDQCRERLGVDVEIPHLNATDQYAGPNADALSGLFTASVRERIAALCGADLEIYHEARRLHQDRSTASSR